MSPKDKNFLSNTRKEINKSKKFSPHFKFRFHTNMLRILVIFICLTKVFCINNCVPCNCTNNGHLFIANCLKIVTNLTSVPINLNPGINVLHLNAQPLQKLPNNAFGYLGNLQKITLIHCELTTIEVKAFTNLTNLKDLELSNNKLKEIPIGTFQEIPTLEELFLENNKLKGLKKGLLANLTALKTVNFVHNEIEFIEDDFFEDNLNLRAVALVDNKLRYMNGHLVEHLVHLNTFTIFENPWNCYCNLTTLYKIATKHFKNNSVEMPKCVEPKDVRNIGWHLLTTFDFTCKPNVTIIPNDDSLYTKPNTNITLTCQVQGNPMSSVKWVKNNKVFSSAPRLTVGRNDFTELYNITVNITGDIDKYMCIAENGLGKEVKNVTLINNLNLENKTIISIRPEHINFGCKIPFFDPKEVLWTYNNTTIKNTTNKYDISITPSKNDENIYKSVLTIKNVSIIDEGLYRCANSKTKQYFHLITLQQNGVHTDLTLIISLCVVLPIILIVLSITVWYYKCRKASNMKRISSHESISLKILADGPENEDEFMDESLLR